MLATLLTKLLLIGLASTSLSAQIISTIAGAGIGDGGPATSALLNRPISTAVDSSGNLYIADQAYNRVRKVAAGTGTITTVAGTGTNIYNGNDIAATSANLGNISSIAIDSSGNLYIATDVLVRKVTAATGLISTVAGGLRLLPGSFNGDGFPATNAFFYTLESMAIDSAGNIYLADSGERRIRKISASTGLITTVAGGDGAGSTGDNIAATDARLGSPTGVAVDSLGNLYIADKDANRIRKVVLATGVITTVAGTGAVGYDDDDNIAATKANLSSPRGVAVDKMGNFYIQSTRIKKVTISTGIITTVAGTGPGGLNGDNIPATSAILDAVGITASSSGDMYIAEIRNPRIRKVSAATGIITTVAGNGLMGYGDNIVATNATLRPTGVAVDVGGNVYVADAASNRVRKITKATGVITTVAGNGTAGFSGDNAIATSAALHFPSAVAVDLIGNLYIADQINNRVRKVTAATGIITTIAGIGPPGYNGDHIPAINAWLQGPNGIAVDSSGNLYISDQGNGGYRQGHARIRKIAVDNGIITTVAGGVATGYNGDNIAATNAWLARPSGVAVDGLGNLYIADSGNNRIRKVAAGTGIITTVAGFDGPALFADDILAINASVIAPGSVAVDSVGNIYIADRGNNRIRIVNAVTGIINTIAGSSAFDGFNGDNIIATTAMLGFPTSVAVDLVGDVYFADQKNDRVRKVTTSASATTLPNYQGLWWNAPSGSESGWGINFAHQGNILFATWFTYDASGKALWLTMTGNRIGKDYLGTLYQTRGPAFNAIPFSPAAVTTTPVGSGILTFTDANNGEFNYILAGTSQTKQITRQVFGPLPNCTFNALPNSSNYQDLWWAAPGGVESGWGVNFTHQGDTIFATWFTYDSDGAPLWLSATAARTGPGAYTGTLYRTTGPAFNAVPFLSGNIVRTEVGALSLAFINGNSGSFGYTLFGITQSKPITRQVFGTPTTFCQ